MSLSARDQQFAFLEGGVPVDPFPRRGGLGVHQFLGGDGCTARSSGEADVIALTDIEQTAEIARDADGPVQRRRRQTDPLLDLVQQLQRVLAGTVPLVDDGDHRDTELAAHLEQLQRLRFEALGSVDEHDRSVDGGQYPVGVLREVGVTGSVDEVDDVYLVYGRVDLVVELQRGRAHRDAASLLHFHPVRHRRAAARFAVDGTGFGDDASVQRQCFGQRGLTGVGMGDDGERAAPRDLASELSMRVLRLTGRCIDRDGRLGKGRARVGRSVYRIGRTQANLFCERMEL